MVDAVQRKVILDNLKVCSAGFFLKKQDSYKNNPSELSLVTL